MGRRVWILVLAAPVVAAAVLLISSARGLTASAEQAQASNVEVKIDNFSFGPATLTVAAGTTVTWTNRDDIPHTVVSVDKAFKSKVLDTPENDGQGGSAVTGVAKAFDPSTVLLAKHAQHVVLVHFPIALFITGVAFDWA